MRTETVFVTVPVFRTVEDENGEFTAVEQIGEREVDTTELFADEGKQFIRIADGHYVGEHITLGTEDSAENYSEMPITENGNGVKIYKD